jgi:Fe-S cluster assembly iron-binding protein IscA
LNALPHTKLITPDGGSSGMSYVMEFEDASKVGAKDTEIKYDGFRVVVDPKSLMFIYGMTLNYRYKHILLHRYITSPTITEHHTTHTKRIYYETQLK